MHLVVTEDQGWVRRTFSTPTEADRHLLAYTRQRGGVGLRLSILADDFRMVVAENGSVKLLIWDEVWGDHLPALAQLLQQDLTALTNAADWTAFFALLSLPPPPESPHAPPPRLGPALVFVGAALVIAGVIGHYMGGGIGAASSMTVLGVAGFAVLVGVATWRIAQTRRRLRALAQVHASGSVFDLPEACQPDAPLIIHTTQLLTGEGDDFLLLPPAGPVRQQLEKGVGLDRLATVLVGWREKLVDCLAEGGDPTPFLKQARAWIADLG